MTLTHICDFGFRNLSDQELTFPPTVDIIAVTNCQGKTNLIEVINLDGLSRSFRTCRFQELIQHRSADSSTGTVPFPACSFLLIWDAWLIISACWRQKN
jgi:recombinational DNA repair ATPase RecF